MSYMPLYYKLSIHLITLQGVNYAKDPLTLCLVLNAKEAREELVPCSKITVRILKTSISKCRYDPLEPCYFNIYNIQILIYVN